ncbi:kinase-like domain-containing protein [Mycena floridula]|nr:kinase-like domain-containing protein [Mycena floridula]
MGGLTFIKRRLGIRTKLFPDLTGQSSYCQTYKAVDRSFNSMGGRPVLVTIKVLANPDPRSSLEKFQDNEDYLHEKVNEHPNIITLHERIFERNYTFMVLAYCGWNLCPAIAQRGRYRNADFAIKRIMLQIIDAVEHCHMQGVCYPDLKPQNILLDGHDHVYLADLGLSTDECVSLEFGCGTAAYLSPESLRDQGRSTVHSNIWAIGIILINLITGQSPWKRATNDDRQFNAFVKDPKSLHAKQFSMSEAASRLIRGVLTIDLLARTSLVNLHRQIVMVDTFWTWPIKSVQPPQIVNVSDHPTPEVLSVENQPAVKELWEDSTGTNNSAAALRIIEQ